MRKGSFAVLLLVTAVAALGTLFALQRRDAASASAAPSGPLFPGLTDRVNDVASLVVTSSDGTVTLKHGEAGWTVDERDGYAARFETVKELILGIAGLRLLEAKTSRPELYGKLGLGETGELGTAAARVTLADAAGVELASVLVGNLGPDGSTVYVRRAGDTQCWLATGSLMPQRTPGGWVDREFVKLPSSRVREISIRHADGEVVTISKDKAEDVDWQIRGIPDGSEPRSAGLGRTIAVALESLSFDDVAAVEKHPLPDDERVTAVFETFDGLRVNLTTAAADGKSWVAVHAETTEAATDAVKAEASALATRLAPWVCQIPDYRAGNLRKRLADLIQPKVQIPATPEADAASGSESADPAAAEVPPVDSGVTPQPVTLPGQPPADPPAPAPSPPAPPADPPAAPKS